MWRSSVRQQVAPLLKERVFSASSRGTSSFGDATTTRGEGYKEWDKQGMAHAVKAVIEEGMSIRKAALRYNIPRSTLGDHVSGRVLPGKLSGPPKLLMDREEDELEQFLCDCARIGYGKTRKDVMSLVNRYLSCRGVNKPVSNGWWSSFCKRHPGLVLRTSASLSRSRYLATNQGMLDSYFSLLQKHIEDLGLNDKPGQIFNMDESGMPLNPRPLRTINQRGVKNPSTFTSTGKAQITVVGCVSASGTCIPPMVIWDRKTLSPELAKGEVPGTIYGLSESGWMDAELFNIWFKKHFLRHVPAARPLLLLMDGHSSHYCLDAIKLAADEGITLFVLPPNTSHLTQPLDKGIFAPLKLRWREVCHQYLSAHPGRVVTRYEFSQLFAEAWLNSMTMSNIVASFRTTGVYPVNRNAIELQISSPEPIEPVHASSYTPAKSQGRQMIKLYHPKLSESFDDYESDLDYSLEASAFYHAADHESCLKKFLSYPSPPVRRAGISEETSARVITSGEKIKELEEKKRKKEEEKELKKKRADERRMKKEMKEKQPGSKKKKVIISTPTGIQFSAEEHTLYSRRVEEGYDLPDERYTLWLERYHPKDSIDSDVSTMALDDLFLSSEDDQAPPKQGVSGKITSHGRTGKQLPPRESARTTSRCRRGKQLAPLDTVPMDRTDSPPLQLGAGVSNQPSRRGKLFPGGGTIFTERTSSCLSHVDTGTSGQTISTRSRRGKQVPPSGEVTVHKELVAGVISHGRRGKQALSGGGTDSTKTGSCPSSQTRGSRGRGKQAPPDDGTATTELGVGVSSQATSHSKRGKQTFHHCGTVSTKRTESSQSCLGVSRKASSCSKRGKKAIPSDETIITNGTVSPASEPQLGAGGKDKRGRKQATSYTRKGKQTLAFAESFEEDKECDALECIISTSEEVYPVWIGCDVCDRWFHLHCLKLDEPVDDFICADCTY